MSGLEAQVKDGGVLEIRLNRPSMGNAIDLPTAMALQDAVRTASLNDAVRAVLVTSAGSRFCTGGDLVAMMAATDRSNYVHNLATTLDAALIALDGLSKPVVCAVQGAVAGAGMAVMLAADVIVAENDCRFTMAYSRVGLTPDCGVSWLLPRAVGQVRALDLAVTGRTLTAAEALDWGLVSRVEPDARGTADRLAATLANGPRLALGQTRRLVRSSWNSTRTETGRDEARTIAATIKTEDAAQRMDAFSRRR
ncbi:enoyl-CoA hydratase/isomerase family protein [Nocardioides sp. YIM 152315]|uniref:enoyl-CoA hydratase/isomerase family protein n=1 Tax=Nocardioides sp. YIM 152315 TaxID=3031760 RepID=UPI0023DCA536|nr:enoyl-CoA hydratase/isomerase family protein [Nocardioides sp. YIM 152315]MDF1602204.1 enoyl-CoA hydratase/isomerase family protein [Nocardioides sp. YIM 152315]